MPAVTADPRYPIGKYDPQPFSIEKKVEWLAEIKFLPLALENAILNLDEQQLMTPTAKMVGQFTSWSITLRTVISTRIAVQTGVDRRKSNH
jgi:hypothetical protein